MIAFLPEDLAAFSAQHPQIRIDLEERVSSEIIHAVREGLTDIGIFAGHVQADGVQVFPYRRDRLVLVVPNEHPLASRERVTLLETVGYDFIGLQKEASLHTLLSEAAQQAGVHLRVRIQVRSFEAICRMIHTGLGIGVLPEQAVRTYLPGMAVRAVAIEDAWALRELNICVRQYDSLSLIARQMVDHLAFGNGEGSLGQSRM